MTFYLFSLRQIVRWITANSLERVVERWKRHDEEKSRYLILPWLAYPWREINKEGLSSRSLLPSLFLSLSSFSCPILLSLKSSRCFLFFSKLIVLLKETKQRQRQVHLFCYRHRELFLESRNIDAFGRWYKCLLQIFKGKHSD